MQECRIEVLDVGERHCCIGRMPNGKVVMFDALAVPGDEVRVKITQEKKRISKAILVEMLQPSADRIEAPCRYFGECGGCRWQMLPYEKELTLKQQIVESTLTRLGSQSCKHLIKPIVPSDKRYGYRSRATLQQETHGIGFHALASHHIVPIEYCMLLDETSQKDLHSIQKTMKKGTLKRRVVLPLATPSAFELYGIKFQYDPACFTQANLYIAEKIMDKLVECFGEGEEVADLFCGVGTFTLPLAKKHKQVWGFEIDENSLLWARKNALKNNLPHVLFQQQNIYKKCLPFSKMERMVVDPPRSGLNQRLRQEIIRLSPQKLMYISCNPATFARDMRELEAGGLTLKEVTPFDMFPCTNHIELCAYFENAPNPKAH